jgi:hypothetical protein
MAYTLGQKMIRAWIVTLVCTLAVFAGSCWLAGWIFRTSGIHIWANAQFAMRSTAERLSWAADDEAQLPPLDELNAAATEIWRGEPADRANHYSDNLEFALEGFRDDRLRVWDHAPVIVPAPSGPYEYGLYLAGEDGTSSSGGEDPDDINSWTFGSTSFYYDRLKYRRWIRNGLWALLPSALAFRAGWILVIRRSNKPNKPRRDNHYQPFSFDVFS